MDLHDCQIPPEEYELLAAQFNPVKFSAKEWVSLAKNAGMKYIVFTSKHCEGFSLFDTEYNDYNVIDATPFKRDIVKELSDECRRQGIKMCVYYVIMDWHHPDYLPRRSWDKRPSEEADFSRYVEYMKGQIGELVQNYDPDLIWFDGGWEDTWTREMGWDMYNYIRDLKPDIIINNRVGKGRVKGEGMTKEGNYAGDFGTPEKTIPAKGLSGVDWESCMTMNDTWGYKKSDHQWQSTQVLIHILIDIASKGGNYLLNVGPTAEGVIPEASVQRLKEMGKWMAVNGESIYGTTASPIGEVDWGRCTAKGNKLYLHIFDWPASCKLQVPGIKGKVERAYLLADKKKTAMTAVDKDGKVVIDLPAKPLGEIVTVVVLEMEEQ